MHAQIATLTTSTKQCKIISKTGKTAIANAYEGEFLLHDATTPTQLLKILDEVEQNPYQSITLPTIFNRRGIPLNAGESIGLTTKKQLKKNPDTDAITRSQEYLKYTNRQGYLLFDIDDGGTYDELVELFPELQGVGFVVVPSSSSFIFNADGSVNIGAKGWHIYINVLNMSDAERIADILWGKMWIQGKGNIKISKGIHPAMLKRGLWDKAVLGAPERIVFEAAPELPDGLTRDAKQHRRAFDGIAWDTEKVADLTKKEIAEIAELIKKAKAEKEPERKKAEKEAKKIFIEKSEKAGSTKDEALRNWAMLGEKKLPYDFIVHTEDGERQAGSLDADDDGLTMADPNEPDYNGGSFCAVFYWNDGIKPKISSRAHGGQLYSIAPHPDDWKTALMLHVILFNQDHAQVLLGGKHRIVRENAASKTLEFFDQKELEKFSQNSEIKTGEKINERSPPKEIFTNKIKAWAEHKDSRIYKNGVIFEPNAPEKEGYYNTWRGFSVKSIKADDTAKEGLKLIKDHIEEIVCVNDPALIKYFYRWNGDAFQNPEKQAGAVVVLVGEKGTGKSIIGHFLRNIWGAHGVHISSTRHLVGNFNAHLADVCFLFADEAFYAGDKAGENVLKSLITEPMLAIERKGIDTTFQKNRLKIFMATNSEKAVPASRDERRYCVFNVSNEKRGDRAYFDALNAAINNPAVQAAFLHEMLTLPLTGFHTGDIPESAGLKEQRLHSLSSAGLWFFDCLERGSVRTADGNNTSWEQYLTIDFLHKCYINWCDGQRTNEYSRVSVVMLGRYLSALGFESERKWDCSKRVMMRDLLTLDEAKMAFKLYEKIEIPHRKEPANCGQDGQDGKITLSKEKHEKAL